MNIIGIIPARMGSTRFPGKPLAKILGMPMIGHMYYRSKMSKTLDEVYVATCDKEIADYVGSIGGKAVITNNCHERATDRTAEAMVNIEKTENKRIDFVAMIQGDEPLLVPEMIDDMVLPVKKKKDIKVVNLVEKILTEEEFNSPNIVKAVIDQDDNILYFSRESIPSRKKYNGDIPMLRQLGIILFERDILLDFSKMKQTPLEIIESVDMNRFLENGIKIKAVPISHRTHSVDTKEDLLKVEEMFKTDVLKDKYLS